MVFLGSPIRVPNNVYYTSTWVNIFAYQPFKEGCDPSTLGTLSVCTESLQLICVDIYLTMEIKLIPIIFQSTETLGFHSDFPNLQMSPGSSRRGGGGVASGAAGDKSNNGVTLSCSNTPASSRLSNINDREIINV